jgi:2-methylcitrate dehydratase PrpD
LGAAAAATRIFGLTREQIQVALGIAASLTAGLSQNFGTMVKPLHLGNAARNGIMAAELASMGFTGNPNIFDQQGGFFSALKEEETSEKLGKTFRFLHPASLSKRIHALTARSEQSMRSSRLQNVITCAQTT